MQLQFTAFGDDEESSLPAMSPFAMRNEGKVFNRSEMRGSGVVESMPGQTPAQVYTPPIEPQEPFRPHVPEPTVTRAPVGPAVQTHTLAPEIKAQPIHEYILYALLVANGLTLILCIVIATRKQK
jgi:hypothetical protein